MTRRLIAILLGGALLLFIVGCAGAEWILQVPAYLLVGWIGYVSHVVPNVTVNRSGLALVVLCVPVCLGLGHALARWLWNGLHAASPTVRPWHWKWTLLSFATLVLMFVAGLSATGVVHQTGWLIRSPQPLVESSWTVRDRAERAACAASLRLIDGALRAYVDDHAGTWPIELTDVAEYVAAAGGNASTFACPMGMAEPARGAASQAWINEVRADPRLTVSYGYARDTVLGPNGIRRVRAWDADVHRRGGINVLYDDGTVDFVDQPDVQDWLDRVAAATPSTRRSSAR